MVSSSVGLFLDQLVDAGLPNHSGASLFGIGAAQTVARHDPRSNASTARLRSPTLQPAAHWATPTTGMKRTRGLLSPPTSKPLGELSSARSAIRTKKSHPTRYTLGFQQTPLI